MLDLRFRKMQVIWDFVGDSLALQVVAKYDAKIMYPLLVQTYFHLNPMKVVVELIVIEDDDNFFGKNIYNDDAIMSTVRNELHLFYWLIVGLVEIENPLRWWVNHAMQFPHVSFLACQMLRIVGFQIEIVQIFNVDGIITNLQQSRLEIDNLDHLVLVTKNWLNNAHARCDGGRLKICMITYKLN